MRLGIITAGNEAPPTNNFSIALGDADTIHMKIVNVDCFTQEPQDLTSCTEIVVNLPNADGTIAQLKLSLSQVVIDGNPLLAHYSAPVSSVVSALLNVGQNQTFDVTFTIGSEVFTVPFTGGLTVFQVAA